MAYSNFSHQTVSQDELMEQGGGPFSQLFMLAFFPVMTADHALSSQNVKDFINSNNYQFDIVINEEFFHDAFLMFGHKFQAPTVTICESTRDSVKLYYFAILLLILHFLRQ